MFQKTLSNGLLVLAAAQAVSAHTWSDYLTRVGPNGAFTGAKGYQRGMEAASNTIDVDMVYKILERDGSTNMCKDTQQPGMQNTAFPRLKAAPGDFVSVMYAENGHSTSPQIPVGKPYRAGNVYVYGTTDGKTDEKLLDIHDVWNQDGTGGDKRGKLLATHFFDDQHCYEDRVEGVNGTPLWSERKAVSPGHPDAVLCQTPFQIPQDAKVGDTLSVYWYWDWPLFVNTPLQSNESYTICSDIDIVAPESTTGQKIKVNAALAWTSAAIQTQLNTKIEVMAFGTNTSAPPSIAAPATSTDSAAPSGTSAAAGTSAPAALTTLVTSSIVAPSSSAPQSSESGPESLISGSVVAGPAAVNAVNTVTETAPAATTTVTQIVTVDNSPTTLQTLVSQSGAGNPSGAPSVAPF